MSFPLGAPPPPSTTPPLATAGIKPSPVFFAVLGLVVVGLVLLLTEAVDAGLAVFVLVTSAWVLSLIFHEFAHAVVAWKGGDQSVAARGYLTLDPRTYADPLTSVIFPVFLVLAGGIGLPGGAVWINRRALRSPAVASAVSLAGPITDLVFACVCLAPLTLGLIDEVELPALAAALAFLGFIQVTAFGLNMLPVPGLDGFGAIEPFLPPSILRTIEPIRRYSLMVLFLALWFVDPFRRRFFDFVFSIIETFGIEPSLYSVGYDLFRFWE